jgi:hypothetical protein
MLSKFVGLREDKDARNLLKEQAGDPSGSQEVR